MKKIIRIHVLSLLTASAMFSCLFMTGCGAKQEEITRIEINKDGNITHIIHEDFDREYYSVDDLSDMASEEISYYNSEYTTPKIKLNEIKTSEDGKSVKMVMTYNSALDYSHFNQVTLFYGTVEEAIDKGYDLSGSLVDTYGVAAREDVFSENLDKHIIVSNYRGNVICPYKIAYMSQGVKLNDNKEAVLSEDIQNSVVLLLSK